MTTGKCGSQGDQENPWTKVFKAQRSHLLECVVNDLVDAEVGHPKDDRAGH